MIGQLPILEKTNVPLDGIWVLGYWHFSTIYRDHPVPSGGRKRSTHQKSPPNSKSLATVSYAPARNQTRRVVQGSKQSVAMH